MVLIKQQATDMWLCKLAVSEPSKADRESTIMTYFLN